MEPKEDLSVKEDINYWLAYDGLLGFSRIDDISTTEYRRPKDSIYLPIPKVMSMMSSDEALDPSVSTTIKLVFRFYKRMETGLIYKFVGYEL